jgi:hypothetical protein
MNLKPLLKKGKCELENRFGQRRRARARVCVQISQFLHVHSQRPQPPRPAPLSRRIDRSHVKSPRAMRPICIYI